MNTIEVISISAIVSKETRQRYEELVKRFSSLQSQKEPLDLDQAIIESGIDTMLNKEPAKISDELENRFNPKESFNIIELAGLPTNANFPGMINLYIPKNETVSNSYNMHLICDGFGYTQANKDDIVRILSNIKENIEKSISDIKANRLD